VLIDPFGQRHSAREANIMMLLKQRIKASLTIAFCAFAVSVASAETYPSHPIRLIVGFAPGGSTDVLARAVGQELSARLGQPVVVENRPGAGTLIAAEAVSKASPDGYTLMYGTPSTLIAPLVQQKSTFQIPRDLVPISIVTTQPMGIMVAPDIGIDSMQGLVRFAKANPGKINFASSGNGTSEHLIVEALSSKLGIQLTHVPYKGASPALNDLLTGRVHLMVNSLYGAPLEHVKTGKIRLIALTGSERNPFFPTTPSMKDVGIADFSFHSWSGVFAPPGTPAPVIDILVRALKDIERDGKLQKSIEGQAMTVKASSPPEAREFVSAQAAFFSDVISTTNIRLD
jgi:tripartite-type tricarboxylate transporter receptor subunit TctC